MELGNMMFGNSRGEHPVNRDLQDEWYSYMEKCGFDGYGLHDHSNEDCLFENAVFSVRPYYWGDCTCGYDEREWRWSKDHDHADDCYQSELRYAKIAAGGIHADETGYIERPQSISYDDWNAIERSIYDQLCAKHGLDPKFGCAVHCTCYREAAWIAWASVNGHSDDCPIVQPNFVHKPSGFTLDWYKYPLRDSYSSKPLTRKLMRSMWADCIASMTAQGMETRQGGDSTAPSRSDDSPVGSADAPEHSQD